MRVAHGHTGQVVSPIKLMEYPATAFLLSQPLTLSWISWIVTVIGPHGPQTVPAGQDRAPPYGGEELFPNLLCVSPGETDVATRPQRQLRASTLPKPF